MKRRRSNTRQQGKGQRPGRAANQRSRRAVVLVVVLVVIAIVALAAYTFSELMLREFETVSLSGKQLQARSLVDSGIAFVRYFLKQDDATMLESGGMYNNPTQLQAIPIMIGLEAADRGNFSVLSPAVDENGLLAGVRYGLEDESNRLNLNTLLSMDEQSENGGRTLLMALPGMTEDVADAILDWMDEDDEPREFGTEGDYYTDLTPAYAIKNGPLDTVEELLLVKGVLPELLFGIDVNRNGVVDPFETMPGEENASATVEALGMNPRGWSAYLTLHSKEGNYNKEGFPRIFINSDDMEQLQKDLSSVFSTEWTNFIIAYRQYGAYTGSGQGKKANTVKVELTGSGDTKLVQILDLIGARVQIPGSGDNEATILDPPFSEDLIAMNIYLPILLDNVTINPAESIPGRININQAPRELLLGIPGIEEEIVDEIINLREFEPNPDKPNRDFETWILAEGIVTLPVMKALSPFINAGGDTYRAQVVGYFEDGTASSRAEVIFDATAETPRVLFWRDLGHLGRGYSLETLGVQLVE